MLCGESKLFIGLSTGDIFMYDPFTLEMLGKTDTNRKAIPVAMVLQSTGTLLVAMHNSTIEVFSFQQSKILPANHINNEIKVAFAGEIYSITLSTDEICLATFSGIFFGRFEVGPQGRPFQVWQQSKIYLRDKTVSQILEIKPKLFLVAEYSKPGYWLVNRNEGEEEKSPILI